MILPTLLMRKRHIIGKLSKCGATSQDKAVTFEQAGIASPNGFQKFTLRLVEQGVICQCGDKFYLPAEKE